VNGLAQVQVPEVELVSLQFILSIWKCSGGNDGAYRECVVRLTILCLIAKLSIIPVVGYEKNSLYDLRTG
jgi:hypothetical protein